MSDFANAERQPKTKGKSKEPVSDRAGPRPFGWFQIAFKTILDPAAGGINQKVELRINIYNN